MKELFKNGAAPDRTGEWARKAYEMLADFPAGTAGRAAAVISACYEHGGKVLACGNGGSAAEAQHLVTELVGRFERNRASLPAVALDANSATLTAVSNDYGYCGAFAHQLDALGDPRDVLVAISTSGDSENVVRAVLAAREKGMSTVGYLGGSGGRLAALVDVPVVLPALDTATIQAGHLVLTHTICGLVEETLFPNKAVFLDRDGTLIANRHYGSDPDEIELLDGVVEGSSDYVKLDIGSCSSRTSPGWPADTSARRRWPICTTSSRGCSTPTGPPWTAWSTAPTIPRGRSPPTPSSVPAASPLPVCFAAPLASTPSTSPPPGWLAT